MNNFLKELLELINRYKDVEISIEDETLFAYVGDECEQLGRVINDISLPKIIQKNMDKKSLDINVEKFTKKLETVIEQTPTGDMKNLLTEANLVIHSINKRNEVRALYTVLNAFNSIEELKIQKIKDLVALKRKWHKEFKEEGNKEDAYIERREAVNLERSMIPFYDVKNFVEQLIEKTNNEENNREPNKS